MKAPWTQHFTHIDAIQFIPSVRPMISCQSVAGCSRTTNPGGLGEIQESEKETLEERKVDILNCTSAQTVNSSAVPCSKRINSPQIRSSAYAASSRSASV